MDAKEGRSLLVDMPESLAQTVSLACSLKGLAQVPYGAKNQQAVKAKTKSPERQNVENLTNEHLTLLARPREQRGT
jgi:hypothetical protein